MIKPNDLRIGNYFHSPIDGTIKQVLELREAGVVYEKALQLKAMSTSSHFHSVDYSAEIEEVFKHYLFSDIKPVLLSKEILSKCPEIGIGAVKMYIPKAGIYLEIGISAAFVKTIADSNKLTAIIYLHQLQNLYFAITGEELNIKL